MASPVGICQVTHFTLQRLTSLPSLTSSATGLQMMLAIGGVIGPGYFVGMGTGLSTTRSAGLLICFASLVGNAFFAFFQIWKSFAPGEVQALFMTCTILLVFVVQAIGYELVRETKFVELKAIDFGSARIWNTRMDKTGYTRSD
ncbi:hypothetical protein QQZ08_005744 [Neonectria magnoliae]|uniref:Uncharacterized protein n=1 Tax=Neonectria magnoliae TaxID=2732573 RepID=A0ABR1I374_9HYPO